MKWFGKTFYELAITASVILFILFLIWWWAPHHLEKMLAVFFEEYRNR